MPSNRIHESDYRRIAEELNIDSSDVRKAVQSFFSVIAADARKLPFDNHKRIYSKDAFDRFAVVRNIPYIGRIGPVYSRYLKWRVNESKNYSMASRDSFRSRWSQGEIEDIAAAVLSGRIPPKPKRLKWSEMFDRIWMVGKEGKKSAVQVIRKQKK